MLMPPLTYIHASEAARTTVGVGVLTAGGGRGVGGSGITPPLAVNGLVLTKTARGAPEAGRCVSVPQRGRDALSACLYFTHRTNN